MDNANASGGFPPLWDKRLSVINIGPEWFGQSLETQETPVVYVDWVPPVVDGEDGEDGADGLP